MAIEKQFVPYDLALKLKELGFDEDCICYYASQTKCFIDVYSPKVVNSIVKHHSYGKEQYYKAPLWQQAFDWFRVEHGYYGDIYRNGTKYLFSIEDMNIGSSRDSIDTSMGYEEARQACLEKLIEIVKTSNYGNRSDNT